MDMAEQAREAWTRSYEAGKEKDWSMALAHAKEATVVSHGVV